MVSNQTSNITGQLTEIQVMQELVKLGWHVARPFSDACHVDLLVLDNYYNPYKIQVKTAYPTKKGFRLKLTKSSNREVYKSYEVDYFATIFENKLYMVPFSVVNNRKSCSFSLNSLGRLDAEVFEFPTMSESIDTN